VARYSAKNPAPKRCATCVHAHQLGHQPLATCEAAVPAWVTQRLDPIEEENVVSIDDHRDPKCPLWQARGPTTH
jgi:hypothetical protein